MKYASVEITTPNTHNVEEYQEVYIDGKELPVSGVSRERFHSCEVHKLAN